MKVLHYYSYDSPKNKWVGGGGAYLSIERLKNFNSFNEVHLYTGKYSAKKYECFEDIHIHYIGLGFNYTISRISHFLLSNINILIKKSDVIGYDIVPYMPILSVIFKRKKSFGVLTHIVGKQWLKKRKFLGYFLYLLEKFCISICPHIIVINNFLYRAVCYYNRNSKVLLSACGFHPELLKIKDKTDHKEKFLLYLGRFDIYMKGLDILIQSFKLVCQKNSSLKLILAGKSRPEQQQKICHLIKENFLEGKVIIQTNITEKEKKTLLSRCLFFVSPSRYEGFGIAALEANAAGKMVIASTAYGFKSSLKDNYSAKLVNLKEKHSLALMIEYYINEPKQIRIMNQQAKEWANHFSWKVVMEKEQKWLLNHLKLLH